MINVTPGAIPPAWYPDPAGTPRSRWWDGTQWTDHYQEPFSTAVSYAELKAPEGTKPYTPYIWLIAILPILPILGLLTIDWGSMFDYDLTDPSSAMNAQLAIYTSPGYLAAMIGGWVLYALNGLFAFLDWNELKKRGVPRPFHFAWVFLSSIVYVIGRSVVVRRRTGTGIAPMWAAIGSMVVSFIVVIVMMVQMFAAIAEGVSSYTG